MHPLRFPNSGIRAKEEGLAVAGCKGQSAAAKAPCKGAAGHMQWVAARRGNNPQGAATRRHGRLQPERRGDCQRRTRKGRPPAASPQEAAHVAPARGDRQRPARKGLPPAGAAAVGRNV
ncbi:hypothetical protein BHE74_00044829 [Ensete ventricosum]|nr:hypothetical protein GW17_00056490 [Ensete ventricosum]RWW49051.1 hypothetical protein BHE74_00044829 [Ensete ventricosum]